MMNTLAEGTAKVWLELFHSRHRFHPRLEADETHFFGIAVPTDERIDDVVS